MDSLKPNNGLSDDQFKQPDVKETYKIYILKRIFSVDYDEYSGKVIIASSPKAARALANLRVGDEGKIWTDPNLVMCKELSLNEPAIVLQAFKEG